MKTTISKTGFDINSRIQQYSKLKSIKAAVIATSTHGSTVNEPKGTKLGSKDRSRSGRDTVLAIRSNAKQGRDILALTLAQQDAVLRYWRLAMRDVSRTTGDPRPIMKKYAEKLAKYVMDRYRKNIERTSSARGKFADNAKTYREIKQRLMGKFKPPMQFTGQLPKSFDVKVEWI